MKPGDTKGEDDVAGLAEIAGPVSGASAQSRAQRAEVTSRLGTVLRGKYRLDGVLGVGGMAVVYRAIHRNQAEYAIKMLLPEHAANDELRSRFLREGYAANSVKHPGAVRVVDDDVAEDGTAFLVLEILHGIACDKLCTACGGRLPVDAACAIGLQALDVLRSAHMNGIIHRDVKPANLFLLRTGEIKVLDFGIARVRETLATGPHSTGSGVLLGTPAFMAPEQAMGKAGDVDARADIWAMGATLFALMSGLTVHEGDSGRELIVKLVTQPTRSLREVVPDVPTAVAEVVDRALAADRENRWASAADMRDALDAAARSLWQERPPRSVLVSVAGALLSEPAPSTRLFPDPEGQRRVQVPSAEPTLRAHEHPGASDAPHKPVVETARAVSHEGSPAHPRRRISPVVLVALLGVGAIVGIAALVVPGRNESPQPFPSSAVTAGSIPVATPSVVATADPAPSPPLTASASSPVTPSAVPASDAGVAVRSRATPKPERDVPRASAPALPAAPVAASAATQTPAVPAPAATPVNCNPPYYYDSKMNRIFKKECL